MSRRRPRTYAAALVAALSLVTLGACTSDPNSVAAQAKAGDQKGYISGSGNFETISADSRSTPVDLSGDLVDGGTWDSASARGGVVVVNVWGSWCAPCVAEAPDLQEVWTSYEKAGDPVQFIGIDSREGPEAGAAFLRKAGITYPSLSDESGVLILALQGKAPTTPTTLVLDTDGRIAARVSGPVSTSTLTGLVDDVLAES